MKYSKVSGVVRWSGGTTVLERGMSAEDDHPLVQARPDLFSDEAPGARLVDPDPVRPAQEPPPVERATREPGEKRTVGRAPKPKQAGKTTQGDEGQGGASE